MATKKQTPVKLTAKKRTANPSTTTGAAGAPFNEQDPKRRLGNFTTAGEHSRVGGRTSQIVGQTKKKFATDKRKKK
jgi:hypothetical protein